MYKGHWRDIFQTIKAVNVWIKNNIVCNMETFQVAPV